MNENANEQQFNMGYVRNYLDHLDRDGLYQLIQFLLVDNTAKGSIISMANEWGRMYPVLADKTDVDYGVD